MSLLNLNTSTGRGPRSKKSLKMFMGAGLLVAVLGIGSTFAANITLNNSVTPTEFGQGVQRTVYCGGAATTLTLKPFSNFKSSTNSFAVGGITVSGIPAACNNLNFVISVYRDGSDTRQEIAKKDSSTLVTPTVFWTTDTTYRAFDSSKRTDSTDCQKKKGDGPSGSDVATTGGALLSLSSTGWESPCKVAYLSSVTPGSKTANTSVGAFTISIVSSDTTLMSLVDFDKITIETQADVFGVLRVNGTGSGITNGLVNS
jgi:hypothetical protein